MSETRQKKRFTVWFPMKIQPEGQDEGVAVSRNMSEKGLLMASAEQLDPGTPVAVTFRLGEGEESTVRGIIVRAERNEEDPDGLWPHRVAVEFEETVQGLEPVLRRLQDQDPFG